MRWNRSPRSCSERSNLLTLWLVTSTVQAGVVKWEQINKAADDIKFLAENSLRTTQAASVRGCDEPWIQQNIVAEKNLEADAMNVVIRHRG